MAFYIRVISKNNSIKILILGGTMKKYWKVLVAIGLVAALLTGCGGKNNAPKAEGNGANNKAANEQAKEEPKEDEKKLEGEVRVLAAASLTDALNEMIELYNKTQPNVKVNPSYGSSGALQTQIEEGAPADIFLSAAEKQMNALEEKGLIDKETRVPLLQNEVVLITPKNGEAKIKGFEDIANDTVKKIAIADPASVPVGQYSEEIFTKLGNWDAVKAKMVMSQDVRNSLDWVANGEVDCGTVYKTDAFTEKDKVEIIASAPEGSHKPVEYPMAMVGEAATKAEAKDFYDFILSDDAKQIFEEYGFNVK